jgi:hypothetical protein
MTPMQRLRDDRRQAGQCVSCGQDADGKTQCADCLENRRAVRAGETPLKRTRKPPGSAHVDKMLELVLRIRR